ncbi:MAG: DUF6152 family protein [Candidatus Rariloculaceae bacterium]
MNKLRYAIVFIGNILVLPVLAHHSDAGMDMDSIIAFEGTVKEFVWRNPHVYVIVETEQSGEPIDWELQMGPVNVSSRRGWSSDSLAPGDQVTIRAVPMNNGRPYGLLRSVDKEGFSLAAETQTPEVTPPASNLAGKWLTDRSTVQSYPGGFDGFFHALLTLNDKGKTAQAAYDPLSEENPEATCIGRPTPAALVSTGLYLMEIDLNQQDEVIIFRSEWFDEVRTIYMDGRGHPNPSERFVTGHSIGRWEGDTLIIDTANFEDHRSPYQIGVPSGEQKHVIETFRLTEDGTHIDLEFTLEDPEFLAEPMVHNRQLIHSPHLQMSYGECDPLATRRWVNP